MATSGRTAAIWHVDAFADSAFNGNPALVALLPAPLQNEEWARRVADEFRQPINTVAWPVSAAAGGNEFRVRFFTPAAEIPVSGHGALSTAHALLESGTARHDAPLTLHTGAGAVTVSKDGDGLLITLDAYPAAEAHDQTMVVTVLGLDDVLSIHHVMRGTAGSDVLIELSDRTGVESFKADPAAIRKVVRQGLIVTAASDGSSYDFVSRFFAPGLGVDEDWVTGIAHSALFPYWGKKLGKREMRGLQVSRRPGFVRGLLIGDDKVEIGGRVVTVANGKIVPDSLHWSTP